jgi:UDP-N-acetylglucosamine--N-acetylmuramyl-(pentapeptide) pyrophosphoryl-undecaprenol N-acetylglucosamine transferase
MVNMTDTQQPIVLAAGGTGGHIFPAEALAEVLLRRGERVVLVTDQRFGHFKSGALSEVETRTIHAGTIGGAWHKKILGAAGLLLGIAQARGVLRQLKPKVVAGFGGYPSFPTVFSAAGMGIPTVIHEQNSVLGRANRLLAGRVGHIAASFPETLMLAEKDAGKVSFTGNPVRASIRALRDVPYSMLMQDGKMHILITGGSQGASVLSQIIPEAIALLPVNLRARVRLDQQCREAELAATKARYAELGVNADLATFFVDVPARLAASHLVIARAGASTVSELAVAGRPAILVPYPQAMDNHQYYNANAFEDVGGGWVMAQEGFTAQALAARLEAFLNAPDALAKAAANARNLGTLDAAEKLADLVMAATERRTIDRGQDKKDGSVSERFPLIVNKEAAA